MTIKSLTIYCSSSNNLTTDYYDLAEKIGNFFFHNKKHSLDIDSLSDIKNFGANLYFNKKNRLIIKTKN